MDKFLYLTRALSRTKRKNYENYVVNAVYFRVGNKDLYPVSQQCVKASNGKFYYIDLYFPQLKIAIECDEAFHAHQQVQDMLRELAIIRQLTAVDVMDSIEIDDQTMGIADVSNEYVAIKNDMAKYTDLTILRIDVSKDYENVERQIDKCVKIIKDKISEKGLTDIFGSHDPQTYFKNRNTINVTDPVVFRTYIEVYNTIFGKNYPDTYRARSIMHLNGDLYAWLPTKMDVNNPNNKGYTNEISQDGTKIYERTTDAGEIAKTALSFSI